MALPAPNMGMPLAGANGNASPWRIPHALHIVGTLLLAASLGAYALAMTLGRGRFGGLNLALLAVAAVGVALFQFEDHRR